MTEKKKEITERLEREFDVCDKHILRINEALEGLGVNIPMSADCYSNLTTEQVRCIDQFIFRFSKLQDSMGAKIFRHILEYLDEDITALPMRDILNRLERYLIIPSADEWTYIRELRNEISHDYPLLETDVAAILNELFSKTDIIFSIYSKLKSVFNNNRHAKTVIQTILFFPDIFSEHKLRNEIIEKKQTLRKFTLNEIFSIVYQFYKASNLLIRNSDKRIRLISNL